MTRLLSRHTDNPTLYDARRGEWTPKGTTYLGTLKRLTGARALRLLEGRWAAAEGIVYPEYEPTTHMIDSNEFVITTGTICRG